MNETTIQGYDWDISFLPSNEGGSGEDVVMIDTDFSDPVYLTTADLVEMLQSLSSE
jgi:hypothetical protein